MHVGSRISRFPGIRNALIAAIIIAALTGLFLVVNNEMRSPSQAGAREIVFGDLLFYDEALHGEPHVVFEDRERIYLDHLTRDYKAMFRYIFSNQSPGWVMTGLWYFISVTDEPASVGVARCTGIAGEVCDKSTELFGQINSTEITELEVEYDEEWHQFSVEAPGYAVRLDDMTGTPTNYRWLNTAGDVVYQQDQVEPLDPGRSSSGI